MKVVFVSNYLNHHQLPFCAEMRNRQKTEFFFIATSPMSDGRVKMGWQEQEKKPYELRAWESGEAYNCARKIINDSDVAIIGSAPDSLIVERLKKGKLTFKYAERFYKTGTPLKRLPRDMAAAWLHHGRFQKYPLYMLCASAYTAGDAARFGNYKDRCYKWGYFPETVRYDMSELFRQKEYEVPKLLWAGRFLGLKHPDDAVRVAEMLKQAGCRFELDFIGTGPLEMQLRKMIRDKHLEDCVRLLGVMRPEEVRKHMERANIYLFTSDRNEGWGAVLNESMNSGCAVVASHAIGSVPFLVKDGENGLIYQSGNTDMLYEKVRHLLEHPEEQMRLGRAAYETMIETWNAETAAERLIELSKRLLGGEKYPDLYADGPCGKAEILDERWFEK